MNKKKAISPVIATALLIVVAVVAVVSFQTWFGTFSSKIFSDTETQSSNSVGNTQIDQLIGNSLYFNNANTENITLNSIKINGVDCNITTSNLTSGINELNVTSCLGDINNSNPEIVVYTDNKIYSKKIYLSNLEQYYVPQNCLLNGTTVTHLDSYSFYNSTLGVTCYSLSRTCTDGVLSGSDTYAYSNCSAPINATGGTITYSGGYKIHSFTSTGTSYFNVTSTGNGEVEYLIVAGGGGGGGADNAPGAGGGAGGLLNGTISITVQNYSVIVGTGGTQGDYYSPRNGGDGVNSSFAGLNSKGGGGGAGGGISYVGRNGGSGGGGTWNNIGGNGTSNQGYNGGNSTGTTLGSAGGGGAGGIGQNNAGVGGTGLSISITGSPVTYATGGDGAAYLWGAPSATNGTTASANTGNGGGGAGGYKYGGAGGSGIVIIRYLYS